MNSIDLTFANQYIGADLCLQSVSGQRKAGLEQRQKQVLQSTSSHLLLYAQAFVEACLTLFLLIHTLLSPIMPRHSDVKNVLVIPLKPSHWLIEAKNVFDSVIDRLALNVEQKKRHR